MIYITVKDAEAVFFIAWVKLITTWLHSFMKLILAKKEQNSTPVAIAAHHFLHCPSPSTYDIMCYLHEVQIFLMENGMQEIIMSIS